MICLLIFLIGWTNWFGMYLKGNKVGYTQIVVKSIANGYEVSELTNMRLSMMGIERGLKYIAQYKVTPNYELRSFTFELETQAQHILSRGNIKAKKLNIDIKTGGTIQTKTIALMGPVYPVTVLPMIAPQFTPSPKTIEVFDPSIQAVNEATCKVVEKCSDSVKVEFTILGATSTAWVSKDGILLSETQPPGVFIKRESKAEAIKVGDLSPEVLTLYGIPSATKIKNPREVKLLKLKFNGQFLETPRQKLYGDTLIIQTIGPSRGRSIRDYLEPTPFIQCKDKRIVGLARNIVGRTRNPWKKATELVAWVSTNVRDMPTVTIPSAIDVLQTMEGDCGEHSVLFVALARACGIPAREVVGLVYMGDGFYYHAWAKIWAGNWVEVDPTFGQPIADATHIALAVGGLEEQAKIMQLVDKIELKVLEYK